MNKPLTHADIGRLWDEVGGPKLTSEQWSAMHRFCPRLLKEAAPPPQAAPKAERGVQEPFAHICIVNTKDAGPTKFFTAPSDPRGFPVYLSAPAERGVPWQLIETAPKDGRTIIVTRHMDTFGWIKGYARWEGAGHISGWVSTGFDPVMSNLGLAHPTHWMPLPDAPGATTKAERGVHPLTTQEVQRIAETLGAHITGRCNYDCWPGMGYRRDAGGEYTIPVVPGIAYEFARAIERAHGIKDPAAKGGE